MPSTPTRFASQRSLATLAFYALLAGWLASSALGVYELLGGRREAGLVWLLAGLAGAMLGTLLYCHVLLLHRVANHAYREYDALLDLIDVARKQCELARTSAENSSLSDWAKRIVYREKDVEFLRDSIHGAIIRQDWPAAEHLIRVLGEELGHAAEAERLRADLTRAQAATTEEKIAAALERFEQLCAAQKWEQALHEAQRLAGLFPDQPRIGALAREVESRRRRYKNQLLTDYDQAVRMHDMDRAHRLLIELDRYLDPNEAAALKESARGVFKARLLQIGVQFSLAVSDRRYQAAIEIGDRLVREFPNSRYAREITAMMPILRKRAAEEAARHEPLQPA